MKRYTLASFKKDLKKKRAHWIRGKDELVVGLLARDQFASFGVDHGYLNETPGVPDSSGHKYFQYHFTDRGLNLIKKMNEKNERYL